MIFSKSFKLFLKIFITIHLVNIGLIILVMGFWDGGLAVGFPKTIYVINCGFVPHACPVGFNVIGLVIDIAFWYIVAVIIKSFKHKKS